MRRHIMILVTLYVILHLLHLSYSDLVIPRTVRKYGGKIHILKLAFSSLCNVVVKLLKPRLKKQIFLDIKF